MNTKLYKYFKINYDCFYKHFDIEIAYKFLLFY